MEYLHRAHHATPGVRTTVRLRSYTLVEMLIVITLLGIAGALVIPHMVNRDSMNVQAAVRRIIGDICFAQSDALSHQEIHQVHFYSSGNGYCLVRVTTPATFSESSSATHDYLFDPLGGTGNSGQYIVDFSADDRFTGTTISSVAIDGATGRDITFDALGGTVTSSNLPGSGGSFVVSSGTESYRITVSPFTGKLTVTKL